MSSFYPRLSVRATHRTFSDGLSIPFFSVSRTIHSRTLSVTRTWTSRQASAPDWLLWARRTSITDSAGGPPTSQTDIERGIDSAKSNDDTCVARAQQLNTTVTTPPTGDTKTWDDSLGGSAGMKIDTVASVEQRKIHEAEVCDTLINIHRLR